MSPQVLAALRSQSQRPSVALRCCHLLPGATCKPQHCLRLPLLRHPVLCQVCSQVVLQSCSEEGGNTFLLMLPSSPVTVCLSLISGLKRGFDVCPVHISTAFLRRQAASFSRLGALAPCRSYSACICRPTQSHTAVIFLPHPSPCQVQSHLHSNTGSIFLKNGSVSLISSKFHHTS